MRKFFHSIGQWLVQQTAPLPPTSPVIPTVVEVASAPAVDVMVVDASVLDEAPIAAGDPAINAVARPAGFVRVITFLGLGNLNETQYYREDKPDQKITTPYTGYAVHTLYAADETLVFCTAGANANYDALVAKHPDAKAFRKVAISDGLTDVQMWQIFAALELQVLDGDNLIVDISNSFRSIPVIVSAVLQYLHEVRNVKIHRVVYGAYNRELTTPIVSLQPFVDMHDWITATHVFTTYAQGDELASLLQRLSRSPQNPWRKIAQKLRELTTALQLVHLPTIGRYASELNELVKAAPTENIGHYMPIKVLLDKVASEYVAFGHVDGVYDELLRQQRILQWYIEHHLYAQAVLLAREWLVSCAIYRTHYQTHRDAEIWQLLGEYSARDFVDIDTSFPGIGRDIRKIRNNLAHAVMVNANPQTAAAIHVEIRDLCTQICAMKLPKLG